VKNCIFRQLFHKSFFDLLIESEIYFINLTLILFHFNTICIISESVLNDLVIKVLDEVSNCVVQKLDITCLQMYEHEFLQT